MKQVMHLCFFVSIFIAMLSAGSAEAKSIELISKNGLRQALLTS